jgi:Flp pilus assembly protein TadG
LALIIPVLLVMLAGVIDIGRYFMCYMELRDAAQEGANYASIDPTNETTIKNHVKSLSTYPIDLANDTDVTVDYAPHKQMCNSVDTITSVTITVNYNFKVSAPFIGVFFKDQTIKMSATATGKALEASC